MRPARGRPSVVPRLLAAGLIALVAGCTSGPPGPSSPAEITGPVTRIPSDDAFPGQTPQVPGAGAPGSPFTGSGGAGPAGQPSVVDVRSAPAAPGSVRLRLVRTLTGLQSPLFLTNAGDGSGHVFVVEQRGAVRIVAANGHLVRAPFLDIADRVSQDGGERGLLGLAFHPNYLHNGRFFVDYTDRNGDTVVSEFRRRDSSHANPGSERVIMHIKQPYANHNGGMLAFAPDGMLYVGMGDGGSGGDPQGNGQNRDVLLGKLLRVDVDGKKPYAIPSDSPFAGTAGTRPEIWAYGLRNPWRFSFDRTTGALFIGDVGQGNWEEIDVAAAGKGGQDYGWNVMEGRHCFAPSSGCSRAGLTLPVAEYGHDQGCAVTGGYVYRGSTYPALAGIYLFGDYCTGRIWGLAAASAVRGSASAAVLLDSGLRISSFGEDQKGELYVVDLDGSVYRVTATGS
jgi:glucose/arabinose dehydrogenase